MPSFESIYRQTETQIKEAVGRFNRLKDRCLALREENERLKVEVQDLRKRLGETEEKLKLVELTSTIATTEEKKELKRQINEWVREIDNSIRILEGR